MVGFKPADKAAVVALREKRPEPPTGEEADPGLVSLAELKELGHTPASLSKAGFTPQQLHGVGYSASDLLGDPKISASTLKTLDYGPAALKELGTHALRPLFFFHDSHARPH